MGETLQKRLAQVRFENPVHEAVLNLLVAAGHVRERFDRCMAEHHVTIGQYNVLRILKGAQPGGYPRHAIAQRLIERAPDVTRLIDRLEKRGLVERARGEQDRRLSVTRISPRGLELLEKVRPHVDQVQAEIATRLNDRDARALSQLCEVLYADQEPPA